LIPLLHCRFFPSTQFRRIEVETDVRIAEVQLSH
jgi:hypothetical protein